MAILGHPHGSVDGITMDLTITTWKEYGTRGTLKTSTRQQPSFHVIVQAPSFEITMYWLNTSVDVLLARGEGTFKDFPCLETIVCASTLGV